MLDVIMVLSALTFYVFNSPLTLFNVRNNESTNGLKVLHASKTCPSKTKMVWVLECE